MIKMIDKMANELEETMGFKVSNGVCRMAVLAGVNLVPIAGAFKKLISLWEGSDDPQRKLTAHVLEALKEGQEALLGEFLEQQGVQEDFIPGLMSESAKIVKREFVRFHKAIPQEATDVEQFKAALIEAAKAAGYQVMEIPLEKDPATLD